jgi:hypothetical protein
MVGSEEEMSICRMVLDELPNWLASKPQCGDVAYLIDNILDKRYLYVYRGPDDDPYSHLISDQFAADWFMKEVDKLKVKETEMDKRCDNCKYYKHAGDFNFCSHKEHNGVIVPKYTSCPEHEFTQKIEAPFDNLKFFVKDQNTGELEVKYICEDCGRVMETPFHWQFRVLFGANKDPEKRPGYYYWCEACWEKEKKK